jgi:hypothetical protein
LNLRQIALAALAAVALGGAAVAQAGPVDQSSPATPPPPPPPNANSVPTPAPLIGTPVPATPRALASPSAAPSASPSAAPGRRGRRGSTPAPEASPSDTPEPPQFSTMDGVWEVQLQPLMTGKTLYSHLVVAQKGDALSGTWVRSDKDKAPFTGTFDGRLFKLTATGSGATKTTWTLSGYAENFSDMVGLVTTGDPKDRGTPFTATHRKKERIGI